MLLQKKSFAQKTGIINIEGLTPIFEATGLNRNPEVIAEMKRLYNFNLERPPAAVAMDTSIAIQRWVACYLYPDLSLNAALWKLGRINFEGYRHTLVGRVLLASLPIWGPHRLALNGPRLFETILKYGIRTIKKVGPAKYEFRNQHDPGNIEMIAGVAEAALEAAGAKHVRVSIRQLAPDDHILDIEWDE